MTWLLNYIIRKMIWQDHTSPQVVYQIVRTHWQDRFTEDNIPTVDFALRDMFEATQDK